MSSIYHPHGFWNGLVRGPARHVSEWMQRSEYRALHRFARTLKRVPRRQAAHLAYEGRSIQLVDGASFLSAWDEIFVNRIYDLGEIRDHRPVLVDAGANIGLAALYWKIRYKDFDYVGFEPDPGVAACCRQNLGAWGVCGNLIEAAVGDCEGQISFLPDGADGGRLVREGGVSALTVKSVRLSAYLPEAVDLLKIDVEGAEAGVLRDIATCLGRVRAIFVEWHCGEGETGLGQAIELLESTGFECHMQVAIGQPRPFERKQTTNRFFQNINLYGVRR